MTTKLRRQSLVAYGAPLVETIADCPLPQGSQVLVRIERCGVCHSDLHMQDGYFSALEKLSRRMYVQCAERFSAPTV